MRLKGGDPFVFGRGGEEAEALRAAGIEFEVVPGVTSAVAVPAYAGIPVTHRGFASTFAVITGHEDPEKPESSIDWAKLATAVDTLVFLMGTKTLPEIVEKLIANGRPPETPVAVIRWGTTPEQRTVIGTLGGHRRAGARRRDHAAGDHGRGRGGAAAGDDVVVRRAAAVREAGADHAHAPAGERARAAAGGGGRDPDRAAGDRDRAVGGPGGGRRGDR